MFIETQDKRPALSKHSMSFLSSSFLVSFVVYIAYCNEWVLTAMNVLAYRITILEAPLFFIFPQQFISQVKRTMYVKIFNFAVLKFKIAFSILIDGSSSN